VRTALLMTDTQRLVVSARKLAGVAIATNQSLS